MSQRRPGPATSPPSGRPVTRRQLTRRQQEQRRQRLLLYLVGGVLLLVALLVLVPFLISSFWNPTRTVATVGDERITRRDYAEQQLLNNLQLSDPSQLQPVFEAYRRQPEQFGEQLSQAGQQFQTGDVQVEPSVLEQMINDRVLVQSAPQAGINLTEEDVDRRLSEYLNPAAAQPSETPAATATAGPSAAPTAQPTPQPTATAGAGPTPVPTLAPASAEDVDEFFGLFEDSLGVSREDYERLAARPALVRERFIENALEELGDAAEQVHVRHILVSSREEAQQVLEDLRGGASFETLARERSQDQSNATRGGDLGFNPRGVYDQAFEQAAFALRTSGQLSEPVQSEFGWHVIQLIERDQSRPLTEAQKQQVAQGRLQRFIEEQRERIEIDTNLPPTPTTPPDSSGAPTG